MYSVGKYLRTLSERRLCSGTIWCIAGVIWSMNILGSSMGSACFKVAFFSFFSAEPDLAQLYKKVLHLRSSRAA